MNRGILVQREVPSDDELVLTAKGICSTDARAQAHLEPYVFGMAKAYLEIYKNSKKDEKEFFGLRDFYRQVIYLVSAACFSICS